MQVNLLLICKGTLQDNSSQEIYPGTAASLAVFCQHMIPPLQQDQQVAAPITKNNKLTIIFKSHFYHTDKITEKKHTAQI